MQTTTNDADNTDGHEECCPRNTRSTLMKQNPLDKAFSPFVCFVGKVLLHARIAGNRHPKTYLRNTRRIWSLVVRIKTSAELKLARVPVRSPLPWRLYLLCRCSRQLQCADLHSIHFQPRRAVAAFLLSCCPDSTIL